VRNHLESLGVSRITFNLFLMRNHPISRTLPIIILFHRVKFKRYDLLSNFAFNLNLRRYSVSFMFFGAKAFDQDITRWTVGGMSFGMFKEATLWLAKYKRISAGGNGDGPANAWELIPDAVG
jgi:hypothetical protein